MIHHHVRLAVVYSKFVDKLELQVVRIQLKCPGPAETERANKFEGESGKNLLIYALPSATTSTL